TPFVGKALAHAPEPASGERVAVLPQAAAQARHRIEPNRSDPVAPFALDPSREFLDARADRRARRIPEDASGVRDVGAGERNVARLRGLSIEDRLHVESIFEQRDEL